MSTPCFILHFAIRIQFIATVTFANKCIQQRREFNTFSLDTLRRKWLVFREDKVNKESRYEHVIKPFAHLLAYIITVLR